MQNTNAPRSRGRWLVLAVACSGLFMIMLQSNVINLAVTRIQADLGADLQTVQWITTGYLLAFSMLLITLGRLGDELGRKKVFMAGVAVYTLGSLFNGLATGLGLGVGGLILGAVVQGIGGAAMMPATQSLIAANFDQDERGMALGIWGAVSGLAVAVGPTLGGVLTEWGLGSALNGFFGVTQGWRYIYFLNVALGILVFVLAWAWVPESKDSEGRHKVDGMGIVLSSLGLFFLVYGLSEGSKLGWWAKKADLVLFGKSLSLGSLSLTPVLLAAAALLLLLFVIWESRRKVDPLMDLGFFRNRDFTAGSAIAAILSFAMMGTFFLVPVFLQGVLKLSSVNAGLAMLPLALAVMAASPLAGRFVDRIGARWTIMAGLAVMGVGGFLLATFSPDTGVASLILPFLVMGAGIGLAMAPITHTALRTIDIEEIGGASGLLSTIRQLGSVLGIAILVSVYASAMQGNVEKARPEMIQRIEAIDPSVVPKAVTEQIASALSAGGQASQPSEAEMDGYLKFYAKPRREAIKAAISDAMGRPIAGALCDSINGTFRIAAAVAFAGALSALALGGGKKKKEEAE